MNKLKTFLWFDDQAEEAVLFYTSIFKDSKIGEISRYGEAGPGEAGAVLTVSFELNGQEFVALNGGPVYSFSPAISFMVNCKNQEEVNHLWEQLVEGGEEMQCGWLTDKFGVTWQIVPDGLFELINGENLDAAKRATEAMFQMKKIDLEMIRKAYNNS